MKWSPQQDRALRECSQWIRDPNAKQVFYLAGFAGTGKTTLAQHLASDGQWLFAAYTGKAAHVMRQKGCHGASTIHSLIYRPAGESLAHELATLDSKITTLRNDKLEDEGQKELERLILLRLDMMRDSKVSFQLWINSPLSLPEIEGVVVDEVSMVDERIGRDLESFGKKILVLGDPAQLPPVGAGGYYTMREPDVMLTEVHRHARESGILRLATIIREGGSIEDFDGSKDVQIVTKSKANSGDMISMALNANQILVGKNETRRGINTRYRELTNRTDPGPMPGERLVCLRNDRSLGIYNGSQWIVDRVEELDLKNKTVNLTVTSEEDKFNVVFAPSWLHHILGCQKELEEMRWTRRDFAEFDYSYALTVHKSQGSQWGKVVLFNQASAFRGETKRKWLYTGITRASAELMVIV